jgi:hypothetical protein
MSSIAVIKSETQEPKKTSVRVGFPFCKDPKCSQVNFICPPCTTPLKTINEREVTEISSAIEEVTTETPNKQFNNLLLIASRITLTIFSAYKNAKSTLVGSIVGVGYGLYIGYQQTSKNPVNFIFNTGGCSEGFLEKLAGVPFPEEINTVASFAATLEHLNHGDHHHHELFPFSVLSSLTGFAMGSFVGNKIWHLLPKKG